MQEWFNKVKREFPAYVAPFAGKPITYVEIGVWIGGSAEYVAKNILTHRNARGFGIDPYITMGRRHPERQMDDVMDFAHNRLKSYENGGKWTWIQERSYDALREWQGGPIDLLYIDGCHYAQDALSDFVLAWPHLRQGSVVIFDDYGIGFRNRKRAKIPDVPDACEAVLLAYNLFVKIIGCQKQFCIEIIRHPEHGKMPLPSDVDTRFDGRTMTELPNRKQSLIPLSPPRELTAAEKHAGRVARRKRLKAASSH